MMKFGLLPLILVSASVHAKVFSNSYVSFEVPDNWTCVQEGIAWTCSPSNPIESKEAVILLIAKVAGPEDTLDQYLNYLKKPKTITTKVGTPMPSQVGYAQPRMLAGTRWVQAQHLGSEVPDYYTLYLATVKEQLAILVNFSAERTRYPKYNPVFDKAMKTLKIVATQQLLVAKNAQGSGSAGGEILGININPGANVDMMPPPEKKSSSQGLLLALGALVIVAIGGVLWMRKRKKISPTKNPQSRPK